MKMLLFLLVSVFSFTAQAQKGFLEIFPVSFQNKIQRREFSHNAHQRKLVKNGVIDSADVIGGSESAGTEASTVFDFPAGFTANIPPMFCASGGSGVNSGAGASTPPSDAPSAGDQLFIACLGSDFKRIKTILESGININQQHSRTHLTAAHVAIKVKKPEVLAYLASQPGFNPNALSETGVSLLELAVLENDRNSESILLNHPDFRIQPQRDEEPDPIKQFREALAAINMLETADIESDLTSWTYILFNWIHMARHKEVRRLLERCPKLLFCRCEGYFLVHILIAAFTFERKFSIEEVELSELFADILRREPDLARLENKDRKTAFDMAMSENMPHVVKLLMLYGNLPLNVILEYQKRRDFSPELRRTLEEFFHPIRHLVPLEDIRRVDIIQGFENEFRLLQGYEASAWRQMHSILEEQETAVLAEREKAELARLAQEEELAAQAEREHKITANNLKLKEEARVRAEAKEKNKNRLLFAKSQRNRETNAMQNEDLRASEIAEKEKQEQEAKQELVRLSRLGEEQIQEVLEATRNIEELFGASDMFRAVYQNNAWAIEGLFQRRDVDRYERFQGRTALGLAIVREESVSTIRSLLFAPSGKARSHARILLTRSCALDNGTEYLPVFYAVKNKKLHSLKILLEIMKKLQIKPEQNLLDFATALFESAKKGTDGYKILKMIKDWSESNGV